jgi:hypothetical protein
VRQRRPVICHFDAAAIPSGISQEYSHVANDLIIAIEGEHAMVGIPTNFIPF